MRIFWALIAVLVVAAGAFVVLRRGEATPAATPLIADAPARAERPAAPVATVPPTPVSAPAPLASDKPAATPVALDGALRDAAKDAGVKVDLPATPAPAPTPNASAEAPKPAPSPKPAPTPTQPDAAPAPLVESENPVASLIGLPEVPVGVDITREDDGSLLLDHRFIVRGEGTAEKPYEIAWEYLVSASETYKPRLGQKKIPDWLQLINNKHVRITGFIAFPLMAQSPDEMLVMLNQWDGCCIGLPPTPYDAVEIKLKNAVRGDDRLKTFGTVEGLFTIEPYLVKDWLIGLYIMKDAKLSNTTGNQTSPHVTKPQP